MFLLTEHSCPNDHSAGDLAEVEGQKKSKIDKLNSSCCRGMDLLCIHTCMCTSIHDSRYMNSSIPTS